MSEIETYPLAAESLTMNEKVYRKLRGEIVKGQLLPGTRLVHRHLAEKLGTSTIPVIDALRRLEGDRLVVTSPGIGTRVREWQPQELEEIYLLRAANEGIACRLFTERATTADMALLVSYHHQYDTAARDRAAEVCRKVDESLHSHIARAARSVELLRLVENFGLICRTISASMVPTELVSAWVPTPGVHEALVRALQARDADQAEAECRKHVLQSGQQARTLLTRARENMSATRLAGNLDN